MTEVFIQINRDHFSDFIISAISDIWYQNELKPVWQTSGNDMPFNEIIEKLRSGHFSIAAVPLPVVPADMNNDIVIGALSPRENCSYQLAIRNDMYDIMRDLRLKPQARVYVNTEQESEQLKNLHSGIEIHLLSEDPQGIIDQQNSMVDAVLYTPHMQISQAELAGFQKIALHVSEMVPEAGAGVVAFLCHKEDLNSRRLLKSVHQKNIAACTNIERLGMLKTKSFLRHPLSVHVELNRHGHYNTHVFGVLSNGVPVKFNRTQSTSAGIVEYIYTTIEGEFLKS